MLYGKGRTPQTTGPTLAALGSVSLHLMPCIQKDILVLGPGPGRSLAIMPIFNDEATH